MVNPAPARGVVDILHHHGGVRAWQRGKENLKEVSRMVII